MGHPEPSRSGGFCLRSGFPHTAGSPIPQGPQHRCDLIETSGKIAKTGRPPAIASGFRRDVRFKAKSVVRGVRACSPACAPSRRLWRWSAYRSLPSHKAFRPVPRSSRPATSPAASASASSGRRFRWRSRAAPPSPCPASRRRRARPRPCWWCARFASRARPSTPARNWPSSTPT